MQLQPIRSCQLHHWGGGQVFLRVYTQGLSSQTKGVLPFLLSPTFWNKRMNPAENLNMSSLIAMSGGWNNALFIVTSNGIGHLNARCVSV